MTLLVVIWLVNPMNNFVMLPCFQFSAFTLVSTVLRYLIEKMSQNENKAPSCWSSVMLSHWLAVCLTCCVTLFKRFLQLSTDWYAAEMITEPLFSYAHTTFHDFSKWCDNFLCNSLIKGESLWLRHGGSSSSGGLSILSVPSGKKKHW